MLNFMQKLNKLTSLLFLFCNLLIVNYSVAQELDKGVFPRIKDDPNGRLEFERAMLVDPSTGLVPDNIREKELIFLQTNEKLMRANRQIGTEDMSVLTGTGVSWSKRGPFNIGGRTRAIALDVTNENIILAGGVSGGIWRSTNGGASWTQTTGTSQFHSVTALAQDPRPGFTNVWYHTTGEAAGNSAAGGSAPYRGNGLYKSTDGGLTWVSLASTTADVTVFSGGFQYNWRVIVNPSNGYVYVANYNGVARSIDGGTSWTQVLNGSSTAVYTDVAISGSGVLYATIASTGTPSKGIFRSTDGSVWTNITPTTFPTTYNRIVLDVAPSNNNVVYFFAATPNVGTGQDAANRHSFFKYTYASGDGSGTGGTWVNRTANLPNFGGSVGNLNQANYNQYVQVKPDNENVVFIGSTNVYRTTDGFATTTNSRWIGGYSPANNVSRYPNHHPDNHDMIFLPSNAAVSFSVHDGGISKTTNNLANVAGNVPVTWTSLDNGYCNTQAYAVAIDPVTAGDNRIMTGLQDNGKWYSAVNSFTTPWLEEVAGGDGCFVEIAPGTAQNIRYHSTQNGSILRSIGPDPANPTDVDGIQPSTATGQLFVNPFILDANNSNIMYYAGGTTVWRNSNLSGINSGYTFSGTATNWTNMTGANVTGTGIKVSALAVSKSPANVLYYGSTNGQVYRVDNANSGTGTKVDVFTGKGFPATGYVSSIAVDPANSANVLVVFSNYGVKSVFYSTNSGTSWADVSGNLEQNADGTGNGPSVRWVTVHRPTAGGLVYYVGTSIGLFATETLSGTSTVWGQEGASTIGSVVVSMIKTRQSDGLVAIATHANGLFSAIVTGTGGGTTCNVPTGLAAGSVTTTTATLSWAAATGATSYDLQYRVNGTSTWTSVTGLTATSRNLTGLTANTTYEFQVRTNCAGGSSAFSSSATFTTANVVVAYCASKGNSVADEWIQRVQVGTINNNSGANAGYGNFTSLSTGIARGVSTTITITPGWRATTYNEGYAVWIDYNQDGDFIDAGELVYSRAITTTTPVSGAFTIPATATLGNTRMRVSMKYNGVPTACETFSFGEVEDYTININSSAGVTAPTSIAEGEIIASVSLYPNPTSQEATVRVQLAEQADVSIALTDLNGRGLFSETVKGAEGQFEFTIQVGNFAKGLYFVNVVTSLGEKKVVRLIIN